MQPKRIGLIGSLIILAVALPALSVPMAHAFPGSASVQISGLVLSNFSDQFYGQPVNAAREGSTINFNVRILADNAPGQRNITVGVRMDWSTSFVNSSGANPGATLSLQANQLSMVLVAVSIPAVSGFYSNINLALHSWEVRVWNGPANTSISYPDCPFPTCISIHSSGSPFSGPYPVAVYSNAQADGVLAAQQAAAEIGSLRTTLGGLNQLPPGAAKASSELAQASTELSLGDTSYKQGDFASAKTHYTNAENLASSAASDLANQGGGADSAAFWQMILNGTGVLLVGVGVLLAALGSWVYLRRRSASATMQAASPTTPKPA